jgi:CheY-like chemotaxis protein
MSEMIEEIVKMLRETFPRTIEFSLELGPDVPLVTADATQVHQVLLNLCVNARDAMPDGGTLTLMTKVIDGRSLSEIFPEIPNENFVHVSVIDTGIGMDEKTRARIFDPFFTTKEKGKGTGLGLSVVYGVMREHHGYVHVESVPGKGTGFDLYFPIVRVGGVEVSEKPIEQRRFLGGRETLLVVEDEEALIAMIKVTFEANGYCVLQAMDGLQALEVYRAHRGEIALVLTDMGMPKITGEQLFFELRKLNPAVKVVMASGYLEANARSEILKAGVKSFVQKPYLPDELLKTVREILDQHL